jgi:hypothetical protein
MLFPLPDNDARKYFLIALDNTNKKVFNVGTLSEECCVSEVFVPQG